MTTLAEIIGDVPCLALKGISKEFPYGKPLRMDRNLQ